MTDNSPKMRSPEENVEKKIPSSDDGEWKQCTNRRAVKQQARRNQQRDGGGGGGGAPQGGRGGDNRRQGDNRGGRDNGGGGQRGGGDNRRPNNRRNDQSNEKPKEKAIYRPPHQQRNSEQSSNRRWSTKEEFSRDGGARRGGGGGDYNRDGRRDNRDNRDNRRRGNNYGGRDDRGGGGGGNNYNNNRYRRDQPTKKVKPQLPSKPTMDSSTDFPSLDQNNDDVSGEKTVSGGGEGDPEWTQVTRKSKLVSSSSSDVVSISSDTSGGPIPSSKNPQPIHQPSPKPKLNLLNPRRQVVNWDRKWSETPPIRKHEIPIPNIHKRKDYHPRGLPEALEVAPDPIMEKYAAEAHHWDVMYAGGDVPDFSEDYDN